MIGIYKLVFPGLEDWPYVGQSRDIEGRYKGHLRILRQGKAKAKILDAYEITGEEPLLEILEECSSDKLNEREIYWIAKLDSFNNGLNSTRGGDIYYGSGTSHYKSKYTRAQILDTLYSLVNDGLTIKEASKKYGIPTGNIYGIKSGHQHHWVQEELPELYEALQNINHRKSGYQHQRSKFTREQLLEAFNMLRDPNNSCSHISQVTGVSLNQVNAIATGRCHKWLQEEFPKEFIEIQNIYRVHKCTFGELGSYVISPEGEEFFVEDSTTEFAKSLNLDKAFAAGIRRVIQKRARQYKGWTLKGNEIKTLITLVHPDNYLVPVTELNTAEICQKFNIHRSSLNLMIKGKQKTTKGFRIASKKDQHLPIFAEEKKI